MFQNKKIIRLPMLEVQSVAPKMSSGALQQREQMQETLGSPRTSCLALQETETNRPNVRHRQRELHITRNYTNTRLHQNSHHHWTHYHHKNNNHDHYRQTLTTSKCLLTTEEQNFKKLQEVLKQFNQSQSQIQIRMLKAKCV